ncbi:MAG TPA: RsmE family RNA methyltransferase [Terriglobales bacterium]|nr:RsmE family RNA methyltransferase [Terriglobales bacterium]
MARRRFFATRVAAGEAEIEGAGAAHLARVLRVAVGQEYELAHAGQVYLGRVERVSPRAVGFRLLATLPAPAPTPPLALAAALFKFDRFEWMLEKATELGLSRLHLLATRRTDPRLVAAAAKRQERWQRLALEAAQQSRRADGPEIVPVQTLAEFLAAPPAGAKLLLSEEPGGAPVPIGATSPLTLLSGPEGGFAPEEWAAAQAAGFAATSLGPRILRCETAILAALARLG